MTDPRFVGLVHTLLASAQAALGEPHAVMDRRLESAGAKNVRTARRSLELLHMLSVKTAGNLDDTERASLRAAIDDVQTRLDAAQAVNDRRGVPLEMVRNDEAPS